MAVVVCPATVIGDESHGIARLNELGVFVDEFCSSTMRRSSDAGLKHHEPFTVFQRVGIVAGYSYSETVKPVRW